MNIVKQAESIINGRRLEAEYAAERAYAAAMEISEVAGAERKYLTLLPKIARVEAAGICDEKLRAEYDKAAQFRKEAFIKYSINEKDFEPVYVCNKCNDTGYCGGKACICLKQQINALITEKYGAAKLYSFDDSNTEDNPVLQKQLSPIYAKIQDYCGGFPETKYTTLIFRGLSGTGKTHLAGCIADSIIKKGYTVIFVTAFKLNEIFKSYHLDFKGSGGELLENLYTCDMLIIDDLGTENKLKNITSEYLLSLVSERMHNDRHIVITTNLGDERLYERYDGRLISRLFDKSKSYVFNFSGEDLRQLCKHKKP